MSIHDSYPEQTAGKQFSKLVPAKVSIKASRLEEFLTRSAVPSFGLHLAILSAIALFMRQREIFGQFYWLFMIVILAVGTSFVFRRGAQNELVASRQTTAFFCALILLIRALSTLWGWHALFEPVAFYLWITAFFLVVCWLCIRGWIKPLSLVVIATYISLFAGTLASITSGAELIVLAVGMIVLGGLTLQRSGALQYLIGLLFSGLLVIIFLAIAGSLSLDWVLLAAFCFVLLVGFIFYEMAIRTIEYSDAVHFVAQALPVIIVYLIVFLITISLG